MHARKCVFMCVPFGAGEGDRGVWVVALIVFTTVLPELAIVLAVTHWGCLSFHLFA